MSDADRKRITIGFNIMMFIYICVSFIAEYLFSPENPAITPWEVLFKNSPVISITLALMVALVLIITGSYIVAVFWNRFVSDVFKVRDITYQEAIAILLIAGAIFK